MSRKYPPPVQARRCTSLLACFPDCYPACIQPTEQRLHGLPWEGLQPTRIPSANACNQRCQRFNRITPPQLLTIPPTAASQQNTRPPDSPQLLQRSASLGRISRRNSRQLGNISPLFRRIFADDPPKRAPALLHARLHIYARMYEYLHIRNENYIPYTTKAPKPLILPGFKALVLCIRRQKVFTLENSARKPLIYLHLRALHNQPFCSARKCR